MPFRAPGVRSLVPSSVGRDRYDAAVVQVQVQWQWQNQAAAGETS